MEMENEDQNENELQGSDSKPSKRAKPCGENSCRRKRTASRKTSILVFDRSSTIPTYASISDDGRYTFVGGIDGKKYLVDEEDFVAMNEVMRQWRALYSGRTRLATALHALKSFLQVDEEGGTYKIMKVDLSGLEVESPLPLIRKTNIRSLPTSIGKLTQLQELDLTGKDISEIPSEIFVGCKHLRVLQLSFTSKLLTLPDAISNLSELEELSLRNSGVRSLPHYCIWMKLQNLKVLDLSATYNLKTMRALALDELASPMQDANLGSLRTLNLRHSAILKRSSSPSSQPLWDSLIEPFFLSSKELLNVDLSGFQLVKDLGAFLIHSSALERLDLSSTDLADLPPLSSTVYDKLQRIKVLSLTSTPLLRNYPQQQKAAKAAGKMDPPLAIALETRFKHLGCIGLRGYQTSSFPEHRRLRNLLALNRAQFYVTKEFGSSHQIPKALWPILLSKGALFQPYRECKDEQCDCRKPPKERDALFLQLVTFSNEIFGAGVEDRSGL